MCMFQILCCEGNSCELNEVIPFTTRLSKKNQFNFTVVNF